MCSHKPMWIYRDERKFDFFKFAINLLMVSGVSGVCVCVRCVSGVFVCVCLCVSGVFVCVC